MMMKNYDYKKNLIGGKINNIRFYCNFSSLINRQSILIISHYAFIENIILAKILIIYNILIIHNILLQSFLKNY